MLAADEEDEGDIALQIHFTLIQAFCCENDIDIVRVNDIQKLAAIVGAGEEAGEPRDLHCILITVSVLYPLREYLDKSWLQSFQLAKFPSFF